MPAPGDNKPKLQKVINKAIASVDGDTNISLLISVISMVVAIVSLVILVLAGFAWLNDRLVDPSNVYITLAGLIVSVAYLTRKLKNVPDNH